MSCLHKYFTDKQVLRVGYCKQLQRWNGIKELPVRRLSSADQLCFFLWLRANLFYPIPCSENHSQTKNNLQFQILKKDCKNTMHNAKHGVRVNFVNNRKLVYLNIRIECNTVWQIEQCKCYFMWKMSRFCVKYKVYLYISLNTYVLHDPPNSLSLIWSYEKYLVIYTDH